MKQILFSLIFMFILYGCKHSQNIQYNSRNQICHSKLNTQLQIEICDVIQKNNKLYISCKLINKSESPLWITTDVSWGTEVNYEYWVEGNKLIIFIAQPIVPEGILLYSPIYSVFRKLKPGESIDFEFEIPESFQRVKAVYNNDTNKYNIKDIKRILFKIGTYKKNLESIVDDNNLIKVDENILISCFWNNRNEEIVCEFEFSNILDPN